MKNIFISIAFLSALLVTGCDYSVDEDVTNIEQPATQPTTPVSVMLPDGKTIAVAMNEVTPKSTDYEGEGIVYKRTVDASRFLDITGVSPGEVASRVEPAKITTGAAPAINITPDGIDAKETKQVTTFVGTSGKWSFLSTIWQRIKDFIKGWMMWLIIGVVVLFILPIFIPALAPIMSSIVGFIKAAFTWICNAFVPLFAWIKGLFVAKAATQIVSGVQDFKETVKSSPKETFTKDEVISMLAASNNKAQDTKVQDYVATVKETNSIGNTPV